MELVAISYSPILELEERFPALEWHKSTIEYVINNKSKVIAAIRSCAKRSKLYTFDVEDIYQDLIEYLYKCDDYDVQKAVDNIKGTVVSLEGYVNSCIKNCVKRYLTSIYRQEKDIVRDVITDDEGKEKAILDMIEDTRATEVFNNIGYDIDTYLEGMEYLRYKFGIDIFMLLYLRLLTIEDDVKYKKVLTILGISKKQLVEVFDKLKKNTYTREAIKALSLVPLEEAIDKLGKKVYGAKMIKEKVRCL